MSEPAEKIGGGLKVFPHPRPQETLTATRKVAVKPSQRCAGSPQNLGHGAQGACNLLSYQENLTILYKASNVVWFRHLPIAARDVLLTAMKHLEVPLRPMETEVPRADYSNGLPRMNSACTIIAHEIYSSLWDFDSEHHEFYQRCGSV